MIFSHRGNLNSKEPNRENSTLQVLKAISEGFSVEVDIWKIGNFLFLGHDGPQYEISINFIKDKQDKLLLHCKNIEILEFLSEENYGYGEKYHFFTHQNDDYAFTSQGYIINFPGKQYIKHGKSIVMLPELSVNISSEAPYIENICTDYPLIYKEFV